MTLLIQRPVPGSRLRQTGGQLGELLVECHKPCLPLSVAVLQGLHLAVVPQFGVQLHQLLFQSITFALDEFQRLCRRQLLLQLHLLLLQIPQQLAQLGQAALLVLLRQGGDAQLQARQAGMLTIGISQSLGERLAIELEVFGAQGQHGSSQHLVQRRQLIGRQRACQLLVEVVALGAHLLSQLGQLSVHAGEFAFDGCQRPALRLAQADHQSISLGLHVAAARLQNRPAFHQSESLLQCLQLLALLAQLLLLQLPLALLPHGLAILLSQAVQLAIALLQLVLKGLLA